MAVSHAKNTKIASNPIKFTLKKTRLKKLIVDVLLPVEASKKGTMELSFNIGMPAEIDINNCSTVVSISGKGINKGINKEDDSIISFTFDAEMIGVFTLSRQPKDDEIDAISVDMANYIVPVLSDTLDTAMFKTGYPRLEIPKYFPPVNNI
ncbi:MAG: hypothetical protein R8K48_06665 [Gallionella sp.]